MPIVQSPVWTLPARPTRGPAGRRGLTAPIGRLDSRDVKARFALLADYANLTSDGKLNIMGVFDTIRATSVPVVHGQMVLVIRFETDPADRGRSKDLELRLLDADGTDLLKVDSNLQIALDAPLVASINQIIGLSRLRFEHFGRYVFYVTVNGEQKADIPFEVQQLTTTPAATA